MASIKDRLQHAWSAFSNPDQYIRNNYTYNSNSNRPDRLRLSRGNERTIVTAIYNRLALDAASITYQHAKVDINGNYTESIDSSLNSCLNLSANTDQTGRAFMQDIFMSILDEGSVAIVPVETKIAPSATSSIDIMSLRVGKIINWMPKHVQVRVYNEKTGNKEDIVLPKNIVAIVENPFYSVMNENSSIAKRLIKKLDILDAVDEQSGAGKLDMIIQLPYVIKTEARKKQAEERRKEIEMQLSGSKYGIAYTDGTEHITQLNRSMENNLLSQIKYLTEMLYSQLNMTTDILNGTADETAMVNYYSRVIEPLASAVTDEMKRKFLSKTAITQGQSIVFFRNPFKLVPISNIADIADKFTRNEILSSNEIRQLIGMKPVNDERANELRNKNINTADGQTFAVTNENNNVKEITDNKLNR